MSSKIIHSLKIFALAAALLITGGVNATFAADEAPLHWIKKCVTNKSSIRTCLMTEAIILENKAKKVRIQLASIRIQSASNTKRLTMFVQVPNRILLQSGLRFQIDQGKTRVAPFTICFEQACESEISLSSGFVTELKKGNEVTLYFLQYDGKPVTIKVPLAGFTAGFNGKGSDITRAEAGFEPETTEPKAAPKTDDVPKPLPE